MPSNKFSYLMACVVIFVSPSESTVAIACVAIPDGEAAVKLLSIVPDALHVPVAGPPGRLVLVLKAVNSAVVPLIWTAAQQRAAESAFALDAWTFALSC